MALSLARLLARDGRFEAEAARKAYVGWLDSGPFDCGGTIATGLRGEPNPDSQANGALMRISPVGIFGAKHTLPEVAEWARQDAAITHPHPVCVQTNALFAMAVAHAIRTASSPREIHRLIAAWADEMNAHVSLIDVIRASTTAPRDEYVRRQGWVLIALHNALWQLLHARNLEHALVDTVMRGGDTDTNAAICGALLGAVLGRDAIPPRWVECVLNCRPASGRKDVFRPRPERFWPVDALDLAACMVT